METHVTGMARMNDGTGIAYVESGRGPTILFLHPGWGSAADWMPVAGFLEGRFHVVLMDRRRHGRSDWGDAPATLEREVEDVLHMCRIHGPIRGLAGHSAGGLVALHAALADGEGLIDRLVLYDPAVSFVPIIGDHVEDFRRALAAGDNERAMSEILPFAGVTAEEQELIRRPEFWPGIVSRAPQELDFLVSACGLEPGVERYREIRKRTLVLCGSKSFPALKEQVQALARVMPNASEFIIEGQGHMANAFVPRLLAEKIAEFLDDAQAPLGGRTV